jgi:hypothetical protein
MRIGRIALREERFRLLYMTLCPEATTFWWGMVGIVLCAVPE